MRESERAGPPQCVVCRDEDAGLRTPCADCGVYVHDDCHDAARGCPTLGCRGARRPAAELPGQGRFRVSDRRRRELRAQARAERHERLVRNARFRPAAQRLEARSRDNPHGLAFAVVVLVALALYSGLVEGQWWNRATGYLAIVGLLLFKDWVAPRR